MDGEMADVMVTLHEAWVEKIDEAAQRLQEIGLDITDIDRDTGTVQGSIDVVSLPSLQKIEAVAYVRKLFEYGVNFPPGDPRDRDGR